jgi:energy-coupling factor transport system permease protein
MTLFTPLRPDPSALLPRLNPAAKLGAALLLMAVLFVSADGVTAAVVLAGLLGATAASGLEPRVLLARTWPLLLAALSVSVLNTFLAGEQRGDLIDLGPMTIGGDTLLTGIGLGLRLLGIAYAGVLAVVTTDPTDLADSLVQQLRLSPRFAIGALAAARLLPIMADEWQILSLARRARGVEAGRSPVAAVRLFFGQLLALLVAAIRRGTRLALAMEARGFGTRPWRTVARPQVVRRPDWLLIGAATALAAFAVGVSVGVGAWRFVLG